MISWCFPPNFFGVAAGANDGAIDAFAGARLSSVVREIIQNSLDVRKNKDEPVKISFSIESVKASDFKGFEGIAPHLAACVKTAEKQKLEDVVKFYQRGIDEIKKSKNVNVLCVHDYNTSGLTGPIDEEFGSWFALTKGAGMSQKNAAGSLGSFGHGSKAPFAYSSTRCVFYFSRIKDGDKFEDRFQGKSILQSHKAPDSSGNTTQGTGFYGHVDRLQPLLNQEIPAWARELREKYTQDTGTSIYVPYTDYGDNLYPETRITVVANFFYAIMTGALEVTVGEDLITKDTLIDYFRDCEDILENEQDEIDVQHIEDCFKSINTILQPDFHHVQEIHGFGKISWFMRINDELEKRVGLARSSGMLITRRPPDLLVFRNVKQFDMFVCVNGQEGSEFLKKLENPTHDNFEFDRIRIPKERQQARKKYGSFQRRIRDLIRQYAELDNQDEEEVSDLGFVFSDVSDVQSDSGAKLERGETLVIRDGAFRRSTANHSDGNKNKNQEDGSTYGSGLQGGDKSKKSSGGNVQNIAGNSPIKGTSSDGNKPKGVNYIVPNFRAVHSSSGKKSAKLFFDSPVTGQCSFFVSIIGETGAEPVKFIAGGKTVSWLELNLEQSQRYNVDVEFEGSVHDMALQATLVEQEPVE